MSLSSNHAPGLGVPVANRPKTTLRLKSGLEQDTCKILQHELEDFGIGDCIRSAAIKNWQYTVLGIREDGCLDCERIGVTPAIRLVMHPASVELVAKAVTEQEARASIEPPAYSSAPIGAKGARANWKAFQATRPINLCVTGTIPMSEWQRIEAEQKALAVAATADKEPDF